MGNLFGTDGIRGIANEFPLTPEIAVSVGRAVVSTLPVISKKTKVVIGKDTRISGDMLEHALASGISAMGGEVRLAGILPTPGVAFLTASTDAGAGMVISASHNPFYDNGIKIFDGNGDKLFDEVETRIEKAVFDDQKSNHRNAVRETGRVIQLDDAPQRYKQFLKQTLGKKTPFKGLKVVLDCSNGAAYQVAPELFSELGADVEALSIQPDGKNINADCGSEHPQSLAKSVIENKADIGLAFDGDGDRLIAADENGQILTGDRILAICAKVFKQKGVLNNNTVVSTVMSNLGLRKALKELDIDHVMTRVGDRYVLQAMRANGAVIGGEDSGHMIFLDDHTTGDGILSALKLIESMQTEAQPLSELGNIMTVYPQALINVNVERKPDLQSIPEVVDAIESVEKMLGEEGRVLVRYSGTQPLCRVMVEGPGERETRKYCNQIADIIEEKLGPGS
ncbi:MAG: phosphoglucosamine mutase [Desulfobacteraceae bacterium]|jgi:phosphoglucosamine mutase